MKITCHSIENTTLRLIENEVLPKEWFEKTSWVNIYSDDRAAVVKLFDLHSLFTECSDYIKHPEHYSLGQTLGDITILNLVLSNKNNIYEADYIILIIAYETVITIIPESSQIFKKRKTVAYPEMKFSVLLNYLYSLLATDLLLHSNINMGMARARINRTEGVLVEDPHELSSSDVMSLERDIGQLADIIEDQFVGFGILESLNFSRSSRENIARKGMVKGFDPLNKSMTRLEKKAESLRLQYMLIQQEKATRKINFLTIIQAVFVPLTFFAGIYGMNFTYMPELGWKYGYLGYWVFVIVLAVGMLRYFYKHGWFD